MLKRLMNSSQMDWRRPLPSAMRTRWRLSVSRTGWFRRYLQISPMYCTIWKNQESGFPGQGRNSGRFEAKIALTVQLYLTQSSQKREAENFFLMTTVMP